MKQNGNEQLVLPQAVPGNGGRRGQTVVLPRRAPVQDNILWAKIKTLEEAQHGQTQRIRDLERRVEALEHPSVEGYTIVSSVDLQPYLLSHETFRLEGPDERPIIGQFRKSMDITLIRGRAAAVCYAMAPHDSRAMIVAFKPWAELVPNVKERYEFVVELPEGHQAVGFGLRDLGVRNFLFPRGLSEQNIFFASTFQALTHKQRGRYYPPLMLSSTDPGELVSWVSGSDADDSPRAFQPVRFYDRELPGVVFPTGRNEAGLFIVDHNMIRMIKVPPIQFRGRERQWDEVAEWRLPLLPWFSRPIDHRYVIMTEQDSGQNVVFDLKARTLNYLMGGKQPVVFPAGWRFVGLFNQNRTSAFLKQVGQTLTLILEPCDRVESCLKRTIRMTTSD